MPDAQFTRGARARVIIHFKEGRKRKRERGAGAGVSDDVRFAFWRRQRRSERKCGRDFHLNSSTMDGPHE